jgi:hypothetical protein
MRMIGRYCLIVMVAISLIASGMPFAHAMGAPAAASSSVHEMHHHTASDHTASDYALHDAARHASLAAVQHDDGSSPVVDWLNGKTCCSMCATAYVAPSLGVAGVVRVSFVVRYWVRTAFRPETPAFIDPGIPIV